MNPIKSCLQSFSFSILILLISFSSKNPANGQPVVKTCFDSYNPLVNTGYAANLNSLLSSLSSNASANTANNYDFYNSTAAGVNGRDVVYGLYLCRGDVNRAGCEACVQTASNEILTECPNVTAAIVWYDNCLLRYSNTTSFPNTQWSLWNPNNSTDPERFNEYVGNTMNELATQASSGASGDKFATREGNFSAFQNLYSLAQCLPNLSSNDCNTCLRQAISQLPICCDSKLGGRILVPNCNIRYETYPFYNVTPPPPPPSNVTLPPPPNSNSPGRGARRYPTLRALGSPALQFSLAM